MIIAINLCFLQLRLFLDQCTDILIVIALSYNVMPMFHILTSFSEHKSTQGAFSVNSLILNKKDSHIKKKATVHNLIVFLNISIESKG